MYIYVCVRVSVSCVCVYTHVYTVCFYTKHTHIFNLTQNFFSKPNALTWAQICPVPLLHFPPRPTNIYTFSPAGASVSAFPLHYVPPIKEVIACGLPSLWQHTTPRSTMSPLQALDGQTSLFSHPFTIILTICFWSWGRFGHFFTTDIQKIQTSVFCWNVMRHLSATSSPSPDISVNSPLPLCWSTHPNPQLQAQHSLPWNAL